MSFELIANRYNTANRYQTELQLKNIGDPIGDLQNVICYPQPAPLNYMLDKPSTSINWICYTKLPSKTKIKDFYLKCEGYNSDADTFILDNSCRAEYSLIIDDDCFSKSRVTLKISTSSTARNHDIVTVMY
jgi:hypothetical protein